MKSNDVMNFSNNTSVASPTYCKELWTQLGKPNFNVNEVTDLYVMDNKGKCIGKASQGGIEMARIKEFVPAFGYNELIYLLFAKGHECLKIRKTGHKYVTTAAPSYHITADTPANALIRLLIVFNKWEKEKRQNANTDNK